MKKAITICLAVLISAAAFAAEDTQFGMKHIVKGVVLDSLSRQGEPAAVLQFFKQGASTPIAFTTTDAEGVFSQQIDGKGDYYLLFSNVGRKSRTINFLLAEQETVDLGTILIQDDVETLEAGSVVAQRPLVKMEVDKMSYDVANDVDSKASTVLDMLRKVPMVTVDGQDNISVNGSSSFQVTVDGKPSQMFSSNPSQIFKMMPASSVESIEVITNPGVKYDAEGVGGVLNIKMARNSDGSKASTDGEYGTVRLMGGNRGGGAGLFFSMQRGKFTMSLNGNGMYHSLNGSYSDNTREQTSSSGTVTTTSHSISNMKMPIGFGNLNASYEIDSLNLLNATVGLMSFGNSNDGSGSTSVGDFSYNSNTSSVNRFNNFNASLDYQHNWAGVPERTFTLSYQFQGNPRRNAVSSLFSDSTGSLLNLTDRKSDSRSFSMDNTIQADFSTPIAKGQTLSTGAKLILRHNSSDSKLYLWDGSEFALNDAGSLIYDFYNNIAAAYGEWSGNFGKFGLKGGLRYEYTWQKYATDGSDPFSTGYGDLVPTASIQYNFSQQSNIGLSYNMRISRPGISYLNPYRDTSDPTSVSYGNSSLNTEHAHNINLVYNLYTPKFMANITGSYSYNGSGISQYSFYDDGGILNTTYGNIVQSSSTGLRAFMNWNLSSRARLYLNGGLNYDDFRSEQLSQSNHGLSHNLMLGAQYTLPGDIRLSGNLMNMGRRYNLQGWSSGMNMAMLSVSKSFFDDKLSVSLMGNTHLGKGNAMEFISYSEGSNFTSKSINGIPVRGFNISLSYSFGKANGISVKKTKKSISNEDQLRNTSNAEQVGNSSGLSGM